MINLSSDAKHIIIKSCNNKLVKFGMNYELCAVENGAQRIKDVKLVLAQNGEPDAVELEKKYRTDIPIATPAGLDLIPYVRESKYGSSYDALDWLVCTKEEANEMMTDSLNKLEKDYKQRKAHLMKRQ